MEIRETTEKIEEAGEEEHHGGHGGHGEEGGINHNKVAILISALAVCLALVETGGKSAQHGSLDANIEASNLWAFFQAKTIRMTTSKVAADTLEASKNPSLPPETLKAIDEQVKALRADAERYNSEPSTGEGRKELAERAKAKEKQRAHGLHAYHIFEYGAAALEIAIVLASSSIVTRSKMLLWGAMGLGAVGVGLGLMGILS
ncbi:MAG: DUF4337 domain-containing protein [Magnetococcales bacterium]|nr:DUF4337 domain-containing protein [Magnetococcales bacterium]NGZ28540.1 DUF4337 domain-containing protein [Magnetococcales bacterium]